VVPGNRLGGGKAPFVGRGQLVVAADGVCRAGVRLQADLLS